jgi:hypothetical protein
MKAYSEQQKSDRAKEIAQTVNSISIPFTRQELITIARQNKICNYTFLAAFVCQMEEVEEYDTITNACNRKIQRYKLKRPIYYLKFLKLWEFIKEQSNRKPAENGEKPDDDTERNRQSEPSKMHDTRIEQGIIACDGYRVEFNRERQLFRYDDGSHEENTSGWRTVEKDVKDLSYRIVFDEIRKLFNHKLSSVNDVRDKFTCFMNIIRHLPFNEGLTVEKCIRFLKENEYTGKIEKTFKTEFEL